MKVKKLYFDEEIECWENLAEFFGQKDDMENDFENTKRLLEENRKEIFKSRTIVFTEVSYKDKKIYLLDDLDSETLYSIEL